MQIEDIKRWHWVLIALLLGGLMAYSWSLTSPDERTGARGTSPQEFVANVARPKTGNGYTWIRQTVVYPPQEKIDPTTGKTGLANTVFCAMLKPLPDGKYKYEVNRFIADIPFKVGNIQPKSATYSISDYLAETKARVPEVEYRYAWWAQTKTQYALWMGGAVVLIGGIWPSLVNLLIGAGMGRPHREKKEEYDLSRFGKSTPSKSPVATAKAGMSAQDTQKLQDMQEQMEKDLARSGMQITGAAASADGPSSVSAPTVKQLSGVSDPTAPPVNPESNEPKEYGGEYYPVVKPHHHVEDPEKQ